jgi:hypothetical protein
MCISIHVCVHRYPPCWHLCIYTHMCVGVRAREQESERARERESERARERESERARVSERASESNRMKEVVVEKFYAQALTLLSCASSRTRSRSCISRFASSVLTTPMSAGMCFFYVWGLNGVCVRARVHACACMCMHVHACACMCMHVHAACAMFCMLTNTNATSLKEKDSLRPSPCKSS